MKKKSTKSSKRAHVKQKEHESSKKPNKSYIAGGVVIAIVVLVLIIIIITGPKSPEKTGSVTVDMYVMSQCPYGVQAENGIAPSLDLLGDSVDFNLYFIGSGSSAADFSSLHGEPEWRGDMVQACAITYEPKKSFDLVICMNENPSAIPNNWEACADKLNLDKNAIKKCYEGSEGEKLLAESFIASQVAGAQGSPTIKINGDLYQGARDSASFTRAMCGYVDNPSCSGIPICTQASECPPKAGQIPQCLNGGTAEARCEYTEDAKVELMVLNDPSCSSCDSTEIEKALDQIFLNIDTKYVDVNSAEGKKMVEDYNIDVVPAFIFDKNVEQTYIWKNNQQVQTIFESNNGNYKLLDEATGANHYVSEEKRQELLQKIGVVTGDNKPQIDFFVMSYCPYGNQAEEIIEQVYNVLGDSADFNPKYVIYSNYGGPEFCIDNEQKYCSLHGAVELNQDIREACVDEYFGIDKWFEFATEMNSKCNSENADSCWTDVASGLGLDTQKISDCEKSEGITIAAKDKELNNLLGVQGSPQIFIEGVEYNGARDANSILAAMCDAFDTEKPAGCNDVIASTATTAAPAAGACG